MATIYYTKQFTSGTLKGISYITSVTFDSSRIEEMVKWMRDHKNNPAKVFGEQFFITDFSFQNYKRYNQPQTGNGVY